MAITLAGLLLLLFVVGVIALFVREFFFPGPDPKAGTAQPIVVSCDVSDERARIAATPSTRRVLSAADTSGTVVGDSVVLPLLSTVRLSGDLTIIAQNDLVLDGRIVIPRSLLGRPRPLARLDLVSIDGEVRIGPRCEISSGFMPFSALKMNFGGGGPDGRPIVTRGRFATTAGRPGSSGRPIRISGRLVSIEGRIFGNRGGGGGYAGATGTSFAGTGGSARTAAGPGAPGGVVRICAEEQISIGPQAIVLGGEGGLGGDTVAQASSGSVASARAGAGGPGGDVVFEGTGGGPVPIRFAMGPFAFNARIAGGAGGTGGSVSSLAAGTLPRFASGGRASGLGGDGGQGGTVRFVNAVVVSPASFPIEAGGSGGGGLALARGGDGATGALFSGSDGGAATGAGGMGGPVAVTPAFVFDTGATGTGTPGAPGPGGPADCMGGNGGDGGRLGSGGFSGTTRAIGGRNGLGTPSNPEQLFRGNVAPVGRTGGVPATFLLFGAP